MFSMPSREPMARERLGRDQEGTVTVDSEHSYTFSLMAALLWCRFVLTECPCNTLLYLLCVFLVLLQH